MDEIFNAIIDYTNELSLPQKQFNSKLYINGFVKYLASYYTKSDIENFKNGIENCKCSFYTLNCFEAFTFDIKSNELCSLLKILPSKKDLSWGICLLEDQEPLLVIDLPNYGQFSIHITDTSLHSQINISLLAKRYPYPEERFVNNTVSVLLNTTNIKPQLKDSFCYYIENFYKYEDDPKRTWGMVYNLAVRLGYPKKFLDLLFNAYKLKQINNFFEIIGTGEDNIGKDER